MELRAEQHIEVHRFHTGAILGAVILALVLESFLPLYFQWAGFLDLTLLVTIYFALSRRNPSAGLLLGMLIGLAQDSLSNTPLGLYGIAKTVVGFGAASFGSRIDVEHPISRFLLTMGFFHLHSAVLVFTQRLLLARDEPIITMGLVVSSVVNAAAALALFPLLDRLRKS